MAWSRKRNGIAIACIGICAIGSWLWWRSRSSSGSSQSGYVGSSNHKKVIVFVHGITGSAKDTWTCPLGKSWPELIKEDSAFNDYDVYVLDYRTTLIANRMSLVDLSSSIHERLKSELYPRHEQVIFVCHSLGGLVVKNMLASNVEFRDRVPLIYFFGTPHTGAGMASIAQRLQGADKLVRQLMPGDANESLKTLDYQWNEIPNKPTSYCAVEKAPTAGIGVIVDQESATHGCDHWRSIEKSHTEMVKPCSSKDDAYILLKNAIKPETGAAEWSLISPTPEARDAYPQEVANVILGLDKPLTVIERSRIDSLRRANGFYPPEVQSIAYTSPSYAAALAPKKITLLGGLQAEMAVYILAETGGRPRVLYAPSSSSALFALPSGVPMAGTIRFVVLLFPLDRAALEIIRSQDRVEQIFSIQE